MLLRLTRVGRAVALGLVLACCAPLAAAADSPPVDDDPVPPSTSLAETGGDTGEPVPAPDHADEPNPEPEPEPEAGSEIETAPGIEQPGPSDADGDVAPGDPDTSTPSALIEDPGVTETAVDTPLVEAGTEFEPSSSLTPDADDADDADDNSTVSMAAPVDARVEADAPPMEIAPTIAPSGDQPAAEEPPVLPLAATAEVAPLETATATAAAGPPPPTCTLSTPVRLGSWLGARCLETRLVELGLISSVPDDELDWHSAYMLGVYERSVGLPADSVADPAVLQSLGIWREPDAASCGVSVPLRLGSWLGSRCVESRLQQLGVSWHNADDDFDWTSAFLIGQYEYNVGVIADSVADATVLGLLGLWRDPPAPTCTVSTAVRHGSGAASPCTETRLQQMGFPIGAPDTHFDWHSAFLIGQYEYNIGVIADSIADAQVLQTLGIWAEPPTPNCRVTAAVGPGGTFGARCVESRLAQLGLFAGSPDDYFDWDTYYAVRDLQNSAGLSISGTADVATLHALGVNAVGVRILDAISIGTSAQGRPILAYRLGTLGGRVVVVVGSIHGDERAGISIANYLRDQATIPFGIELWIIPTVNPDGNVLGTRTNARGVDLNRNFPANWGPIDCRRYPRNCSGPAAASEPETQAIMQFLQATRPAMTVWYHGADYSVDSGGTGANPNVAAVYAAAVGYRLVNVPCNPSGVCTGTATSYGNAAIPGSSAFVVELPTKRSGGISVNASRIHADGVWRASAL